MTVMQYEQPPPLPASLPEDELADGPLGWVARLRAAAEIAAHIAETDFVPQSLRGNAPAIAAAILYGSEVGLEPMQSLTKIAVIRGRPTLTSEAMRAMIQARGHDLWLEEATVTRCIACGQRADSERVGRVMWTLDDAKRAGIAGGENWRRYPREMLVARAFATLARQMFADVIGGLAASEEIEDESENGAPRRPIEASVRAPAADAESAPTTTRRRRRSSTSTSETRGSVAPTPPADEQSDEPAPIDPLRQMKRMFALMGEVGFPKDDRELRIAWTSRVIGRPITSSSDLSTGEVSTLISELEEIGKLPPLERAKRLVPPAEADALADLEQLSATEVSEEQTKEDQPPDDGIPF